VLAVLQQLSIQQCCGAVPFDTVLVPVPSSYFPSYGSGSGSGSGSGTGSLHNLKINFKMKFLSIIFL
jgi:hypothetical protein